MKKPLRLYQEQRKALERQRAAIDVDVAQVLAEGLNDGYSITDLLDWIDEPKPQQKVFDL